MWRLDSIGIADTHKNRVKRHPGFLQEHGTAVLDLRAESWTPTDNVPNVDPDLATASPPDSEEAKRPTGDVCPIHRLTTLAKAVSQPQPSRNADEPHPEKKNPPPGERVIPDQFHKTPPLFRNRRRMYSMMVLKDAGGKQASRGAAGDVCKRVIAALKVSAPKEQ